MFYCKALRPPPVGVAHMKRAVAATADVPEGWSGAAEPTVTPGTAGGNRKRGGFAELTPMVRLPLRPLLPPAHGEGAVSARYAAT